ncbi:MAG: LEA type 2 family protein [Deltaproteobacteria bacterium]|nr:LEA type 2 family protein [Deltaproteobacteria bacterium]
MLNPRWRSVMVSAMLALLAACSASFQEPQTRLVDARIDSASVERIKTTFTVEIDNPNSVGAKVTEVRYTVFAEGVKVIEEKVRKDFEIKAKSKTRVDLPARITPSDLAAAGLAAALNRRVNYTLKGEVTIDTPIGDMTLPISDSGVLKW